MNSIDTRLRKGLPKNCSGCNAKLLNSMEQLVECCPFCYRTHYHPAWKEFLEYMDNKLNSPSGLKGLKALIIKFRGKQKMNFNDDSNFQ